MGIAGTRRAGVAHRVGSGGGGRAAGPLLDGVGDGDGRDEAAGVVLLRTTQHVLARADLANLDSVQLAGLASEMPRMAAWPLACVAAIAGLRAALREARKPMRHFEVPAGQGRALLDGTPLAEAVLSWRGPLAFLRWRESERETERRLFHAALVVISGESPIFGMRWVGTRIEAALPEGPMIEFSPACGERGETPQWTRKSFQPAGRIAVVRSIRAQPHLGTTGREVRHERRRQINRKFLHVRPRAQRILGDRHFHNASAKGGIYEPTRTAEAASLSGRW